MHPANPGSLLEATFKRIRIERMADMPMVNPALSVVAVDFDRKNDDWRGVLVTPWGINLLLLPAVQEWPVPGSHERAFRQYASGTFAFLPNHEDELGDYLACSLIHDMAQFEDQETAVLTARACLIALDLAPENPVPDPAVPERLERRRFFTGSPG